MSYYNLVRGKWIYEDSKTIDDMVDCLVSQINYLRELKSAGVELDSSCSADDYFVFHTNNEEVANKLGFEESYEDEYINGDDNNDDESMYGAV